MGIQGFEQSRTWQASVDLSVAVYKLAKELPEEEKCALSSQLRRSVISVSTNIAEGFGRAGPKEKLRFYNIAYGSLVEVKSLLIVSVRLGLLEELKVEDVIKDITSVQKQLNATKTAVKSRLV